MSESLVDVEPAFGIELAAIAERGVIAPTATFTVFPKLLPRRCGSPRDDLRGASPSRGHVA